jgi:hypothetical protein
VPDRTAITAAQLRAARRIVVLGSPGVGKSTLARRLAVATGLPAVHLDDLHWLPDWGRPERGEWQRLQTEAAAGERWIIDGNYEKDIGIRSRRADLVLLVHRGRLSCLHRVLRRRSQIGSGSLELLPAAVRRQASAGVRVPAHADLGRLVRTVLRFRPERCLLAVAQSVQDGPAPDVVVIAERLPRQLRSGADGRRPFKFVTHRAWDAVLDSICKPSRKESHR